MITGLAISPAVSNIFMYIQIKLYLLVHLKFLYLHEGMAKLTQCHRVRKSAHMQFPGNPQYR